MFFVVLALIGIDVASVLLTFGTFVLGFSFMYLFSLSFFCLSFFF